MAGVAKGQRISALGLVAGALLGIAIRHAPSGELWLAALLGLTAALVALAQQTLP